MTTHPEVFDTADTVGRVAAEIIADGIARAAAHNEPFVIGCPTGRSPVPVYRNLARITRERSLDLSGVVIALMDEYVEDTADGFRAIDATLPHSCLRFGREDILEPLNAAAAPGHRIPEWNLWYPDPETADGDYDRAIADAGGIDVFLLASGASDGHIALNPVGADANTLTRVVGLGEATRRDNLQTFPTLGTLENAPRYGVTVGLHTITTLSRSVIMVITGEHKQQAVTRLVAADTYDPEWPATIFTECASARLLVDRAAAGQLQTTS